jgi:MATE family multidrug resistance protein
MTTAAAWPTLAQHVRRTVGFALPVMVARAGLVIMVTVDTVMSGRFGAAELAYYGISFAPQIVMLTVGIGLLVGVIVLTAQADGAGRPELRASAPRSRARRRLGLVYALALSRGDAILSLLGQGPEITAGGGRALALWGPGMPAILMFVATTSFLEGIGRPRPGMVAALGANLLNAGLNWVFIFGHLGAPAMGAAGAVLATTLTRWAMVAALVGYVLTMGDRARYGVRAPLAGRFGDLRRLLALGAPFAAGIGLETSAFAATATFAGWLGAVPLAGYQVALNATALIYMLAIGLSTATAVRVANAIGRQDRAGLAWAGWVGTGVATVLMLAVAAGVALGADGIAALYSGDAAVRAVATAALHVVAWIVVVDGAQGVLIGATRGAADVAVPTAIYALSFWAISVPMGYGLGVVAGYGVPGLMWSLFAGLLAAGLLLGARFHVISRRPLRPL